MSYTRGTPGHGLRIPPPRHFKILVDKHYQLSYLCCMRDRQSAWGTNVEQVAVRVPEGTLARAEALIDVWKGRFEGMGVTKAVILRAALLRGLSALETESCQK